MPETAFDIAILGSSPLSGLLAGVLVRDHHKRVIRIGRRASPQRLPRTLDLALPLATRPQSWRLTREAEAETSALLAAIGAPAAITANDVVVIADTAASSAAMGHAAHMALGFGLVVRPRDGGWTFRGVAVLQPAALDDKLFAWLTNLGVTSVDNADAELRYLKSGVAELWLPDGRVDAPQIVLADDAALLDHLPEAQRPATLLPRSMTATLTASRRLAAPVMLFPDRGVTLVQRDATTVLALVSGDRDVEARLATALPGPFPVQRLATSRFRRIVSTDGAPLIGRLKPSKLFVVAGLQSAAFFAPALARLLAGETRADDKRWFLSHDPARIAARETIADVAVEAFA